MAKTNITIPAYFKEREPLKAFAFFAVNIIVVVFTGILAYHLNLWYIYILGFIIVGARAQELYILQSECMHWLLFKNKLYNNYIGMLIYWLFGTRLYEGRIYHFKHHKELGNSTDPNEDFHNLNHLITTYQKNIHFLKQLIGFKFFNLISKMIMKNKISLLKPARADAKIDFIFVIILQGIIALIITLSSSFWVYLLLYFLPIATLTSFFESVRSFSEHTLSGEIPSNYAEQHRLYFMHASKLELFFISQFNFNYHHFYPFVLTFKLKKLHNWLLASYPDYHFSYIERPRYLKVFEAFLFNKKIAGSGLQYPK